LKFEQLLQIYWSKGFLFNGRVRSFNVNLKDFFLETKGFNLAHKIYFIKRFELTVFNKNLKKNISILSLNFRKIINMYFSQLTNINSSVDNLIRYNLIRLYLIKSFRGKAQALGKPSRGQRTWSNASTAFKTNKILRLFINNIKKNFASTIKVESKNLKLLKKKKKKFTKSFKIKEARIKELFWL
jgi:ribosomal protein S13